MHAASVAPNLAMTSPSGFSARNVARYTGRDDAEASELRNRVRGGKRQACPPGTWTPFQCNQIWSRWSDFAQRRASISFCSSRITGQLQSFQKPSKRVAHICV